MSEPAPDPSRPAGRAPLGSWLIGMLLVVAAAAPAVLHYLVFWPDDQWQVDVEVYRQAGQSLLTGRPVYSAMTDPPQLLPFTYPPFAAVLSIPLALMPFRAAGWLWTLLQVAATTAIVWYAGRRFFQHLGRRAPIALGLLAGLMIWLQPVTDGLRFGQVNAFIVLACLLDLSRTRPRWLRHLPPGVLVGLAMSIKLTPGVFVVHYLVNRRWREAATAIGAAAAATLGTWLLLPEASFAFWGGALQDSNRLGPNAGTANQSLRGVLLRIGPEGAAGTLLWLVLISVVGVLGYRLARRAWLAGDAVTEVGVVGLLACLLSPVAWIHHMHWMVVVIFAILGPRPLQDRARLWAAAGLTVFFLCRLPWWGIGLLTMDGILPILGAFLQNIDALGALAALGLMHWSLARGRAERADSTAEPPAAPRRRTLADVATRSKSD